MLGQRIIVSIMAGSSVAIGGTVLVAGLSYLPLRLACVLGFFVLGAATYHYGVASPRLNRRT